MRRWITSVQEKQDIGSDWTSIYDYFRSMNFDLLIANISKHISLTPEETTFFTSLLKPRSLANGEYLLREGQVCKYESFVVKGCVKTYYVDENGFDNIIDFSI